MSDDRKDLMSIERAKDVCMAFEEHLNTRLWGRNDDAVPGTIQILLNAFFSGGHILFEDYPGSGKSFMAVSLSELIHDDDLGDKIDAYRRIQCTPDLMPGDITGGDVFQGGDLVFRQGPVFAHFLLVDEINRTTPKTQSALLEAMAEKKVTVDGKSLSLGRLFFVVATQNPLDRVGTYELPAAQLDRFLFKRSLRPIDKIYEARIMLDEALNIDPREKTKPAIEDSLADAIREESWFKEKSSIGRKILGEHRFDQAVRVSVTEIVQAIDAIKHHVKVHHKLVPKILDVAERIDRLTHSSKGRGAGGNPVFLAGSRPSVRSMQWFIRASKVRAFIESRGAEGPITACPRHFREISLDLLRHRVVPFDARMPAGEVDELLVRIVNDAIPE